MDKAMITFIGAGNMGGSLIRGLIQQGHPSNKIMACDLHTEKLAALKNEFGIQTSTDNNEGVAKANVVILAIKPQIFAPVTKALQAGIHKQQPLVISIAAGIRTTTLEKWLNGYTQIVRAMPNTPALIGYGATALYASTTLRQEFHQLAQSILQSVGKVVWLPNENQLDAATALSGSGPAYFFLFQEAMENAAIELGLPAEIAHELTLQTGLGAAQMAMQSKDELAVLRKNVTSPGGTTERAIGVLVQNKLPQIIHQALTAAKVRAHELAVELDKE